MNCWVFRQIPQKMITSCPHADDINMPLQEAARPKVLHSELGKCQRSQYFCMLTGNLKNFFRLSGQLAQPNHDHAFFKRAAVFCGIKSKVGHTMAKAAELVSTSRQWSPVLRAPVHASVGFQKDEERQR